MNSFGHTHTDHTCIYIHIHIHTHILSFTLYHIHTYTLTHLHTHTHSYIHTHIHTYIHSFSRTYIYTHTHKCSHTYIHAHTHTFSHTHTHHIHTHTHSCTSSVDLLNIPCLLFKLRRIKLSFCSYCSMVDRWCNIARIFTSVIKVYIMKVVLFLIDSSFTLFRIYLFIYSKLTKRNIAHDAINLLLLRFIFNIYVIK